MDNNERMMHLGMLTERLEAVVERLEKYDGKFEDIHGRLTKVESHVDRSSATHHVYSVVSGTIGASVVAILGLFFEWRMGNK